MSGVKPLAAACVEWAWVPSHAIVLTEAAMAGSTLMATVSNDMNVLGWTYEECLRPSLYFWSVLRLTECLQAETVELGFLPSPGRNDGSHHFQT